MRFKIIKNYYLEKKLKKWLKWLSIC